MEGAEHRDDRTVLFVLIRIVDMPLSDLLALRLVCRVAKHEVDKVIKLSDAKVNQLVQDVKKQSGRYGAKCDSTEASSWKEIEERVGALIDTCDANPTFKADLSRWLDVIEQEVSDGEVYVKGRRPSFHTGLSKMKDGVIGCAAAVGTVASIPLGELCLLLA